MSARKPASQRRGKAGTTKDFGVVDVSSNVTTLVPQCPTYLGGVKPLDATLRAWDQLWSSRLVAILDLQSDMPAIERWASLIDERERAFRAFRRERVVAGSQGQAVLSPLWQVVRACDTELRSLEDRIGLTPRARLQLGITYAEAAGSLDELNRLMEEDLDADDEDAAEVDPRLGATEARAT